MEDVERKKFIEFINQAKEKLIAIAKINIEKEELIVSYELGKLVSKCEMLIETLGCKDEDERQECQKK
jgi:hypothetical protein